MNHRSESRLAKKAKVRIFGMDAHGNPVNIEATVLDVSNHGARLTGVTCWEKPGEVIGIRYGTEKARYRIVWVGKPGTPVATQIGVVCVDTGRYIWDVIPPDIEAKARQAASPLGKRGVGDQIAITQTAAGNANTRRKDQRFPVSGGVNVRESGKNIPRWTTLNDLSSGGCYVETTDPLPVETAVDITIQSCEMRIDGRGVVTVKHPLVGMGIRFTEMTPLNKERLVRLLNILENSESNAAGSGS
jgi:PilZ domain-containing protein